MGIPSYFSYLLRHHKTIVKRFSSLASKVDNLYLDSNSIVYDAVRTLPYPSVDFDARLIEAVCAKIQFYIDMVKPIRVFIAFDGVPPMAKMKQQRERRYKSLMHAEPGPKGWNTVQITPGTKFMHALDTALRTHFASRPNVKLSTSEEPGEGEHKIFEHMRNVNHADQTTVVYGLDSDLIILALNHLEYGRIELLREAPAFQKTKDNGLHVLDVALLATEIQTKLGQTKLQDYIFLTLFLGNDFMPHFPALNLRTTGFDTLLQTYRNTISPTEHLFVRNVVCWPVVYKFIAALAKRESTDFVREYKWRERMVEDTPVNMPMVHREMEHYINPTESHWEARYYSLLFQSERQPVARQSSEAYLQMLEWNMQYYTTGCPSWSLYYPYMYPPLLVDLTKYKFKEFNRDESPLSATQLLEFVLPSAYAELALIPYKPTERKPECFWAFCTFLWESHLLF